MLRRLIPGAVPMVLRCPEGDPGGAGGDPGGAQNNGAADPNPPQTVKAEDHQRALQDLHRFKKEAAENAKALTVLQAEVTQLRTKGAEDKGDFKSLYEQTRQENENLRKQHGDFKNSVLNTQKVQTLESTLKKMGLKEGSESLMDFADLEKMPHEVTSKGRILVHGAEELAQELKKNYPFAFSAAPPPTVNAGGGNPVTDVSDSSLTADFMVELERKDPAKYKQLLPRYIEQYKKRHKGG